MLIRRWNLFFVTRNLIISYKKRVFPKEMIVFKQGYVYANNAQLF